MNEGSRPFTNGGTFDATGDRSIIDAATCVATGIAAFLIYLLTLSPDAFWLDSNEWVVAGFTLGIPHPPGHPLYVILAKLVTFLPFGSIAFRVNLLSAIFGALAAAGSSRVALEILATFRGTQSSITAIASGRSDATGAGSRTLARLAPVRSSDMSQLNVGTPTPQTSDHCERILDFGTAPGTEHRMSLVEGVLLRGLPVFVLSLVVVCSPAMWLQSVRAEVYTMQAAAATWGIALTLRWLRDTHSGGEYANVQLHHHIVIVAWLVGLGLTNHHYLMFLVVPSFLLALMVTKRGRGLLWSVQGGVLILIGLSALLLYLYLPIRASADPDVNWADPSTFERFWNSVTAKIFQSSVSQRGSGVAENLMDEYFLIMHQLHPVSVVLGSAGLVVVWLRNWKVALVLTSAILLNLMSTALMHFDSANPDAWGYLQLSTLLMMALTAAVFVHGIEEMSTKWRQWIPLVMTVTIVVATGLVVRQIHVHSHESNLRGFRAPEVLQDHLFQTAPPGSVVFASYYTMTFNYWNSQFTDGRRPDITFVQQTFDAKLYGGKPYTLGLLKRFPEYASIFRGFLDTGTFPVQRVLEHAERTPILLEPDINLPIPVDRLDGIGAQTVIVDSMRAKYDDVRRDRTRRWWAKLMTTLSLTGGLVRETRAVLLWHHLHIAVLYLRQAEPILAGFHVSLALQLNPESAEFRHLERLVIEMAGLSAQEQSSMADKLQRYDVSELLGL